MGILCSPDRAKRGFARLLACLRSLVRWIDWVDDLHTIWSSVLLHELQRFVLWFFFTSGPQGKQITLKHEIKRSFTQGEK
jgi:hypothetical protein